MFYGETSFNGTVFPSWANFTDATFHDGAWFSEARFNGKPGAGAAGVHDARYSRREAFYGATFRRTKFYRYVGFRGTAFHGDARYDEAIFSHCTFSGAVFHGDVRFSKATFDRGANFGDEDFKVAFYPATTFCRAAQFDEVTFSGKGQAYLAGARVQEATAPHVWPPGWTVRLDEGGTGTLTQTAQDNVGNAV